jgi:UDP-N-acetylglucosamine 2-epimerase
MAVFGTRPEAIKMMPIVRELRRRAIRETIVVVTGQHREMLDQVFTVFGERPDVNLQLMTHDQLLPEVTASVIVEMSKVYARRPVDLVLVHGDTTTAMAAALAAFYARIPIGHVEAGLRTFDLMRPWPEELNRVVIDSLADMLFAPTETSAQNLRREYNGQGQIHVTGNTGIDAVIHVAKLLDQNRMLLHQIEQRFHFLDRSKRLVLVTGHRRESFGQGFERICQGLRLIAERNDVEILYPVHLNPNVKSVVSKRLGESSRIFLAEPVDYADMVYLMKRASILLTDSGGIQEEGPALGRPVLVMRDVTERPEALATGVVQLVGTDPHAIRCSVDVLLDDADEYARRAGPVFPYGDGSAAKRIVDAIEHRG